MYLPVFYEADTTALKIAITVDDCDNTENLQQILGLFEKHHAGLTLFPIGRTFDVPGMAELIRDCVMEKGIEIENHTMSHARIFRSPEMEMASEIWEQGQALNRLLGVSYRQHFFRLMGGDGNTDRRTHNYLIRLGFEGIVQWSCRGSDEDMNEIRENLRPGAIYLFHTIDGDVEKLARFLPYAISRGYRPVTLNELLGFGANEISAYHPQTMPLPQPYEEDYRTCQFGDYTWNTWRMQEKLRALNLMDLEGNSTGYYGELTEGAISRYQALTGLPVTGVADCETQKLLLSPALLLDEFSNRPGHAGRSVH